MAAAGASPPGRRGSPLGVRIVHELRRRAAAPAELARALEERSEEVGRSLAGLAASDHAEERDDGRWQLTEAGASCLSESSGSGESAGGQAEAPNVDGRARRVTLPLKLP